MGLRGRRPLVKEEESKLVSFFLHFGGCEILWFGNFEFSGLPSDRVGCVQNDGYQGKVCLRTFSCFDLTKKGKNKLIGICTNEISFFASILREDIWEVTFVGLSQI